MTTASLEKYADAASAISLGEFDDKLADLAKLVELRMNTLRSTRTIDDYVIGATVVFNDYCGTKYLRGQRATVVSRRRTKLVVTLDKPVGRFVRIENGVAASAQITVPPSIVDLVA